MQKNIILILLLIFSIFFVPLHTFAQNQLKGIVLDEQKQPLQAVNIYWKGTNIGTSSNEKGIFKIDYLLKPFPQSLIVSFIGYKTDTLLIREPKTMVEIQLFPKNDLQTVTITEKDRGSYTSTLKTINTQTITSGELLKAACCNLSESFETNAAVDVNTSDALSGAAKIQLLGLDGNYVQMTAENIPTLRGIVGSVGLNYVPGSWLKSIDIIKGSGSVVNGYESMTGQINLEFLKPDQADKFFVNAYLNDQFRAELNTHFAKKINQNWSQITLLHAENMLRELDQNADGFMDNAMMKQIHAFNRWKYDNPKTNLKIQFGTRMLAENRRGGQMGFHNAQHQPNSFGIDIASKRLESFAKIGQVFPNNPFRSWGLMLSQTHQNLGAMVGKKNYQGKQNTAYANFIFQDIINNTNHKYKLGLSATYDRYDEQFVDNLRPMPSEINLKRTEKIVGAFGEYIFRMPEKLTLVAGFRMDYHNVFGVIYTPRLNAKFDLDPSTALRLSGGKGFRVANIFADNLGLLASSRVVVIEKDLNTEKSCNMGINLTKNMEIKGKKTNVSVDYYYTSFQNQLVVDMENPQLLQFYGLDGKSFAKSFQIESNVELSEGLDVRLAYKFDDVKTTYKNDIGLQTKPFVARQKILFNLSYATKYEKWKTNFTTQWRDIKRLPSTVQNPEKFRIDGFSEPYFIINAQITRKFRQIDVYLGGENLLDFIQPNQIIDAQNPFDTHFDATLIWGNVLGRRLYAGLRWSIKY